MPLCGASPFSEVVRSGHPNFPLQHWEFDEEGLMRRRDMSANDYPIHESERRYV